MVYRPSWGTSNSHSTIPLLFGEKRLLPGRFSHHGRIVGLRIILYRNRYGLLRPRRRRIFLNVIGIRLFQLHFDRRQRYITGVRLFGGPAIASQCISQKQRAQTSGQYSVREFSSHPHRHDNDSFLSVSRHPFTTRHVVGQETNRVEMTGVISFGCVTSRVNASSSMRQAAVIFP